MASDKLDPKTAKQIAATTARIKEDIRNTQSIIDDFEERIKEGDKPKWLVKELESQQNRLEGLKLALKG